MIIRRNHFSNCLLCFENNQAVRDLVQQSLCQAHTKGMTSIAFPAIGTENLGIPKEHVSRFMYDEVDKFSRATSTTTLKDVRFVLYDKDSETIKVFVNNFDIPNVHTKLCFIQSLFSI